MDISACDAKEVLREDALEEYEKGIAFFHLEQLGPLHIRIYLIEKIVEFPSGLLASISGEFMFFRMTVASFWESSLLAINRLVNDTHSDFLTLMQFKNDVLHKFLKEEYKEPFQKRLKQAKFMDKYADILKRIKDLRHGRIAHLSRSVMDDPNFWRASGVSLPELKAICKALEETMDALSFNTKRLMLPPEYSPDVQHPAGSNYQSDIEQLLDCVARKSSLLNMPEKQPELWRRVRSDLSLDEISQLNRYRRKFGLPEA